MIELEPNRDRNEGIHEISGLESFPHGGQDEVFNIADIPHLKRARSFVLGIRGEFWNLEMYKRNHALANLNARKFVADIVYGIRPESGDLSPDAMKARESIRLLMEASLDLIKAEIPYPTRVEDSYYNAMANMVRSKKRQTSKSNVVKFRSRRSA